MDTICLYSELEMVTFSCLKNTHWNGIAVWLVFLWRIIILLASDVLYDLELQHISVFCGDKQAKLWGLMKFLQGVCTWKRDMFLLIFLAFECSIIMFWFIKVLMEVFVLFLAVVCSRPTALQDRTRDSDEDDIHDRDYDVAALANNLSQAFRYKMYGNEDNEEVCSDFSLFHNFVLFFIFLSFYYYFCFCCWIYGS